MGVFMTGSPFSRVAQDIGLWAIGLGGSVANVYNMHLAQRIQQQQAEFNSYCCRQLFQKVIDCPALNAAIRTNNEWSQYLFITASAAGFIVISALFLRSFWKP